MTQLVSEKVAHRMYEEKGLSLIGTSGKERSFLSFSCEGPIDVFYAKELMIYILKSVQQKGVEIFLFVYHADPDSVDRAIYRNGKVQYFSSNKGLLLEEKL
jgi:hypothetical protein